MRKIQKIALVVFLVCMVATASIVLYGVWAGAPDQPDTILPKIMVTFFVIGFASFLVWFTFSIRQLVANSKR